MNLVPTYRNNEISAEHGCRERVGVPGRLARNSGADVEIGEYLEQRKEPSYAHNSRGLTAGLYNRAPISVGSLYYVKGGNAPNSEGAVVVHRESTGSRASHEGEGNSSGEALHGYWKTVCG